jgi:hypothetical protein
VRAVHQYLESLRVAIEEARWLTRERLLLCGSCLAFVTIGVVAFDIANHPFPGLTNAVGEHLGNDFVQFWTSARLAATGRPEAAYVLGAPFHTTDLAIAYPPVVMLLCRPLAGLSYTPALCIWGGLGFALFAFSLSRLVGWEMAIFAGLGTPAALLNIFLEQNGFYTATLLAAGLMLVERRPVPAGILIGMLCCKPQLGLLLLPALLAGGHWRVIIAAAATASLLAAVTMLLFGHETWIAFFDRLSAQRQLMETRTMAWSWTPTVFAMMRLIGANSTIAYALQGLSSICAAVAVALLWRGRGSLAIKSAALVTAAFLATPYAWAYDAVVLTLAAAWLANDAVESGFGPWEKICVLVLLTLPALSVIPAKLLGVQLGPILLWLVLAVLMRRGLDQQVRAVIQPSRGLLVGSTALR